MRRSLCALFLVVGCGHAPQFQDTSQSGVVAVGTTANGAVSWCTDTSYRGPSFHFDFSGSDLSLGGFGCGHPARVVSLAMTTDDPALVAPGATAAMGTFGTFSWRALGAGTARVHVEATFDPGGTVEQDFEVEIAEAVSGTRTCKVWGNKTWHCDGTDPAVSAGQPVELGYSNLVDASGRVLSGTIALEISGPEETIRSQHLTSTPGVVTVKAAGLDFLQPLVVTVVDPSAVERVALTSLDLWKEGDIDSMPAEVTELTLTAQQESFLGRGIELTPMLQTANGWALTPSGSVTAVAWEVVRGWCALGCNLTVLHPGTASFHAQVGTRSFDLSIPVRLQP